MRREKPLPKESSFKDFAENKAANPRAKSRSRKKSASKPRFVLDDKKSSGRDDRSSSKRPDRRSSRGNSFKEDRRQSGGARDSRRNGSDDMGRGRAIKRNSRVSVREFYDAICVKCKKPCKVPFKPTAGRGVSCSECFRPEDKVNASPRDGKQFTPRDGNQRFARTNSGVKELFDAVCMKCGNKCKVPFKPSGKMGVSCSNCFVKSESPTKKKRSSGNDKPFYKRRR